MILSALKTLSLIILLAGLGVGGYWLGHHGRDLLTPEKVAERSIYLPPAPTLPKPQKTPYAASPMVAPLSRTVWIPKLSEKDGRVSATIPLDQATDIANGQEIIFYTRKDEELLPFIAIVDTIEPSNDKVTIRFSKPETLQSDVSKLKGRIIIFETVGTKQLPLSSLFYDEAGNSFVFKLTAATNGQYAALFQPVFVGVKGDEYFEVGSEVQMHEMVLANPPEDIQNGDLVVIDQPINKPALEPLAEQARNVQRQINTAAVKDGVQAFENALGPQGSCNAQPTASGLPAALQTVGGIPQAGPTGASAGCNSCGTSAPVAATPAVVTTPAPTPTPAMPMGVEEPSQTAPSSGGGCNNCGGSTY